MALKENICKKFNNKVEIAVIDFSEKLAGKKLIDKMNQSFSKFDILVNNAGVFPQIPTLSIDDFEWDFVQNINLRTPFILSREIGNRFKKDKVRGVILNILSISAVISAGNSTHYVASKHALAGVARVALFAVSELARYVTGVLIPVDGGDLAK